MCAQRPRLPRSCPRSTLRRCHGARPGSGWDWVEPWRSRPRTHPRCPITLVIFCCPRHRTGGIISARSGDGAAQPNRSVIEEPSSTISTAWLQSVTCCPPAAYQPGHLPGVLPLQESEKAHLEAGFPLRCCQRLSLPNVATQRCRLPDNWHTSGSSSPVLSY